MSATLFAPSAAPSISVAPIRATRRRVDWSWVRPAAAAALVGAGEAAIVVVALVPATFTVLMFAKVLGFRLF